MPKRKYEETEFVPQWPVECIYRCRMRADRQWEYWVKWGGYTSRANSYEPASGMDCDDLIERFHKHVRTKPAHRYRVGDVVKASKEHVDSEKCEFQKNNPNVGKDPVLSPRKKRLTFRIPARSVVSETPSPTHSNQAGNALEQTRSSEPSPSVSPSMSRSPALASSPTLAPQSDEHHTVRMSAEPTDDKEGDGDDDGEMMTSIHSPPSVLRTSPAITSPDINFAPMLNPMDCTSTSYADDGGYYSSLSSLRSDMASFAITQPFAPIWVNDLLAMNARPSEGTGYMATAGWPLVRSLYLRTNVEEEIHLCEARLSCAAASAANEHISSIFCGVENLTLEQVHHIMDYYCFMRSPLGLQWLMVLDISSPTQDDVSGLNQLSSTLMHKFTYAKLAPDITLVVATSAFFSKVLTGFEQSSALKGIAFRARPLEHRPPISRDVVKLRRPKYRTPNDQAAHSAQTEPRLPLAFCVRLLQFPSALYDWLRLHRRECLVWPPYHPTALPSTHRLETKALRTILTSTDAISVKGDESARAIFAHVGHLASLLESGGMRVADRLKRGDVCVFTFGTQENIHPDAWGVHEIFKHGGVMTFSLEALLQAPWKARALMLAAHEHPLWMAFVTPFMVGRAARRLRTPSEDARNLYDGENSILAWLLHLIEGGKVFLLDPTRSYQSSATAGLDATGILRLCLDADVSQNPDADVVQDPAADSFENPDATADLVGLQRNFAFHSVYRRFVLVDMEGSGNNATPGSIERVDVLKPFKWLDGHFADRLSN